MIATEETLFLITEHVSTGDMFDSLENHGHMTDKEALVSSSSWHQWYSAAAREALSPGT